MIRLVMTACFYSLMFFMLSGCSKPDYSLYHGTVYPPTKGVKVSFQPGKVDHGCMVFAHTVFTIPGPVTGQEISSKVSAEARAKGANMLLVGMSRKGNDEDVDYRVDYFGPDHDYLCADGWCGWKYGFEVLEKQQGWLSVGYGEWGNAEVFYAEPIIIQAAFLRCR
ncbi:MAG: hypothetical protein OEM02_00980 [Desulfobulbaceae bacterium]|nr:hypothetical protein [Desulfobulbaceae bacterium]